MDAADFIAEQVSEAKKTVFLASERATATQSLIPFIKNTRIDIEIYYQS